MQPLIDSNSLYFSYLNENNGANVLNDVNFSIRQGEFVAIVGHNGSGKSTLAKLFNAIFLPTSGTIVVGGLETSNKEFVFEIRNLCDYTFFLKHLCVEIHHLNNVTHYFLLIICHIIYRR